MSKKTMRKYVRKPRGKVTSPEESHWKKLHTLALKKAQDADDPRVKDLEVFEEDPEKVLRRLSILSKADLNREFGDS